MGPWVLPGSPMPPTTPTPPPARHPAACPRLRQEEGQRSRVMSEGPDTRPAAGQGEPGSNVSPEEIAAEETSHGPSSRNRIAELFWSSPPREWANPQQGSSARPKSRWWWQWGPPYPCLPCSCSHTVPQGKQGWLPLSPGPCPTPLLSVSLWPD